MKCNQPRPGFELVSPCPFPTTITITPRAPPKWYYLTHSWEDKGVHTIFWLFYFTPTLVGRCNALPKKVPKRIIQKKRQQQIRDEDISFILSFIYWVQQPFRGWGSFSWIHWNGWIPQLRCQKYVKLFHVCICPHLVFRASIRVSFLLDVLSKSGKS